MDVVEEGLTEDRWQALPHLKEIQRYIKEGNEGSLALVKSAAVDGAYSGPVRQEAWWLIVRLLGELAPPTSFSEQDRRVLHVLLTMGEHGSIAKRWYNEVLGNEAPDEDFHPVLRREFLDQGYEEYEFAQFTVNHVAPLAKKECSSAGRYLSRLDEKILDRVVRELDKPAVAHKLLDFLFEFVKRRVPALAEGFFECPANPEALPGICRLFITRGGRRYEEAVIGAFDRLENDWQRFQVGSVLADFCPEKYQADALRRADRYFHDLSWIDRDPDAPSVKIFLEATSCMVRHRGVEVLLDFLPFLRVPRAENGSFPSLWSEQILSETRNVFGDEMIAPITTKLKTARSSPSDLEFLEVLKRVALNKSVKHLGREALPAMIAAIDSGDLTTRLEGVIHLLEYGEESFGDIIQCEIERGLQHGDEIEALRFLGLVKHLGVDRFLDQTLGLLKHDDKSVRDEAIRALSLLGDDSVPAATTVLHSPSATDRLRAVQLLFTVRTPLALETLETRLDEEEDDRIREAIHLCLQATGRTGGRTLDQPELVRRAELARKKLAAFNVKWLDVKTLPPLFFKDGDSLTEESVRYLLYLQSRINQMRSSVEAQPIYELIDKERSGEFPERVLKAYIESGAAASECWVLSLIGLLCDDRLIPLLVDQIETWVKRKRGKMAGYAVRALALSGSDRALMSVRSLALRYHSKFKTVGQAAADAFRDAAERRRVSPEELEDCLVPWLGFEPDKPRVLKVGKRRVQLSVSTDFKLRYHDLTRKKDMASLPKAAPRKVAREVKELQKNLQQSAKGHVSRLETLFVNQYRWPRERWTEMFLQHPLLFPFAVRLVWGTYDDSGNVTATFRSSKDGILIDANGEKVDIAEARFLGIVHPVEVDDDVLQGWSQQLAESQTRPPFPQLERPVARPRPEHTGMRPCKAFRGTTVAASTFADLVDKLGWRPSVVEDPGIIIAYAKDFSLARIHACFSIDGMHVEYPTSEVELYDVYCADSRTVSHGESLVPEGDDDPRLLPLEKLPAIVFSEIMSDLKRVAESTRR